MSADDQATNGRRRFLKQVLIAGGTLAVAGVGVLRPATALARGRKAVEAGGAAPTLELAAGTRLGRWTVVEVRPLSDGGIPVILAGDDGVEFQVELTRRDPDPGADRPVAVTEQLALYLSNGGGGNTATIEEHGLGVMTLAAHLAERERQGKLRLPSLLTLRERIAVYRQQAQQAQQDSTATERPHG